MIANLIIIVNTPSLDLSWSLFTGDELQRVIVRLIEDAYVSD